MADSLSVAERSRLMSRIKAKDTKPEIIVRRRLHSAGLRFRLHRHDLPGSPDIVLPGRKTALFVHGCFWHGCRSCDRGRRRPSSNTAFWNNKLRVNQERDQDAQQRLAELGWTVLVIWECAARSPTTLDAALAPILALRAGAAA